MEVPRGSAGERCRKPPSVLPAADEKRLKDQVLNDLSKNLGVAVTAMSPELHQTVEQEIQRVGRRERSGSGERIRRAGARGLSKQPQLGAMFNDRLRDALSGILQVRQNADALRIMQENAKLLKMKLRLLRRRRLHRGSELSDRPDRDGQATPAVRSAGGGRSSALRCHRRTRRGRRALD